MPTIPNPTELILNRRSLLGGAAAMTAAGLVPTVNPIESARGVSQQLTACEAPADVSAAMSRWLAEIARRNELRRQADLPLLSVARELTRMKQIDDRDKFCRFAVPYRQALLAQAIERRRRGHLKWRLNFTEGMACQNEVDGILQRWFRKERQQI